MDDRRNYYRVLHLQPDAPIELVRVNYRVLMQKLGAHPDLGGENWSAVHLNAAYRTLSDPKSRTAYDQELLDRYDIQVIAEGRAKPRARKPKQASGSGGNRRNYFRVLQAQRDAPFEILEASHRALRAAHPEDRELLDEALVLLSNETHRAIYDRLLDVCDHQDAMARIHLELGSSSSYEPVIKSYCAFCKSPHVRTETDDPDASCAECASPLFPPPRKLLELARRTLTRTTRSESVRLFFDWPAKGILAQMVDLSPTGMRCETSAHLDLDDVVKIASSQFDAVGSVAHARHAGSKTDAGMRFLAVRFQRTLGTFRSLKV